METELVVAASNPLDVPQAQFTDALARRGANRKALISWVREALKAGTDYGTIKIGGRDSKESLWKPGAEKICGMLGLRAIFPTLPDYERAAIDGKEINHIILRCHLLDAQGNIVADGVGARSVEKERGDLNKALKMAEKSALIDATLRCAGLSEIFTQDIEDMNLDKPAPTVDVWKGPMQRKHYSTELQRMWGSKDIPGLRQLWNELDSEQRLDIWNDFNSVQRNEIKEMLKTTEERKA